MVEFEFSDKDYKGAAKLNTQFTENRSTVGNTYTSNEKVNEAKNSIFHYFYDFILSLPHKIREEDLSLFSCIFTPKKIKKISKLHKIFSKILEDKLKNSEEQQKVFLSSQPILLKIFKKLDEIFNKHKDNEGSKEEEKKKILNEIKKFLDSEDIKDNPEIKELQELFKTFKKEYTKAIESVKNTYESDEIEEVKEIISRNEIKENPSYDLNEIQKIDDSIRYESVEIDEIKKILSNKEKVECLVQDLIMFYLFYLYNYNNPLRNLSNDVPFSYSFKGSDNTFDIITKNNDILNNFFNLYDIDKLNNLKYADETTKGEETKKTIKKNDIDDQIILPILIPAILDDVVSILDFSNNSIGTLGLFFLGQAVVLNNNIKELIIKNNSIESYQLKGFLAGIKFNQNKSVINISYLNLSNNNLDRRSGAYLSKIISMLPNLENINLNKNPLSSSVGIICNSLKNDLLKGRNNLKILELSLTDIDRESIKSIGSLIQSKTCSLESLNVSHSNFNNPEGINFFKSVSKNRSLVVLYMYDCKINKAHLSGIKNAKSSNIRRLKLYHNELDLLSQTELIKFFVGKYIKKQYFRELDLANNKLFVPPGKYRDFFIQLVEENIEVIDTREIKEFEEGKSFYDDISKKNSEALGSSFIVDNGGWGSKNAFSVLTNDSSKVHKYIDKKKTDASLQTEINTLNIYSGN